MVTPRARFVLIILSSCQLAALAKISPEQAAQLPPPATHQIDFSKEIKPIFEASCIKCHGRGRAKGDFRLDTRETILKGGESGPALVAGNSAESHLIELVMGFDPDSLMPKKGSRLTAQQIGLLRAWIDQGVKWDEGVTFARGEPLNLKPRRPQLPATRKKDANPVDLLLNEYFASHKIKPPQLVDDRTFARRAYLDILGVPPSPAELQKFLSLRNPLKRQQLVRSLLADHRNYAIHWLTFWNDMLRNDYRGTGYIDGGRKQITQWLYSALEKNLPYDQFVAQLINPKPETEGFINGIVWRGVVNASQTPQMQAAQNISQVFMGVNLKCASCHDSFINDWMLSDAYGLAGIYATNGPLEMVRCDKPTGQQATLRFIYPQLGEINPQADKTNRLQQLADLICQRSDGRLTRTLVNRLWQKFLGHGLVEPADDMEKPAWDPDLLDWLAEDFADHGYDVRHTIEQILSSRAYQMTSVNADDQNRADFVFTGPAVRRLTAEQFRDALAQLTGIGYSTPVTQINFATGKSAAELAAIAPISAKWIWNEPTAAQKAPPGTIFLRKSFVLRKMPTEAAVLVACDNGFTLYLNGKKVGEGSESAKPYFFDLTSLLRKGTNFFSVKAVNASPGNVQPTDKQSGGENPAGFLLYARVRNNKDVMDLASDASWIWSAQSKDWLDPHISAASWTNAAELGDPSIAPWKLGKDFIPRTLAGVRPGNVRAALVNADSLQIALGRPNREQVVTLRASSATTLQALELTNGSELADLLRRGAEKIAVKFPTSSSKVVIQDLYQKAFGRKATARELLLAEQIVGSAPKPPGIEDLMWTLAMLPEFQLVY